MQKRYAIIFMCVLSILSVMSTSANLAETKIVWASFRDGNGEIYVVDQDGANPRRLTAHGEGDRVPSWSADGTRVIYARGDGYGDLYLANADGTGAVALSQDVNVTDNYAGLSPDGTKIVFASAPVPGSADIYVMNADGSGRVNLTNDGVNSDSHPHWSPDGTQIAFSSKRDGNWEIYVMTAAGSAPTRLTTNAATDAGPRWSPDGTKIAFTSLRDGDAETYVMDAAGTNQVNVTNNPTSEDYDPDWSPDGTRLAFVALRGGVWDVYTMDAVGGAEVRITNDAAQDQVPRWSPNPLILEAVDGAAAGTVDVGLSGTATFTVKNHDAVAALNVSGITSDNAVFTASPPTFSLAAGLTQSVTVTYSPVALGSDAATITVTHDGPMGSSVIGATGGAIITPRTGDLTATTIAYGQGDFNIATITYDGVTEASLTPDGAIEYSPDWSPDGTKIAYNSPVSGVGGLFVMNPDGTGVVALAPGLDESEDDPKWSPDGARIAFSRNIITTGEVDLYTMAADGSDIVRVTTDGIVKGNVSWSPDGARFAFQKRLTASADSNEIFIINVDGTGETRLTNNAFEDRAPEWSPDGTKIVYDADITGSGTAQVFTMDTAGGNLTNLTNNTAVFHGTPSWSPDGTRIVFRSKLDGQATTDLYHMAADGTDVIRLTTSGTNDTSPSWGPFPSSATVTAADTQGRVGRVATVPINISDVRGLDLTGVTITLTYDPAIITPTTDGVNVNAVTAGAMVPVNWGLEQNVITAGTLSFSMAGGFGDPITGVGGGVLANVAFDVNAVATVGATSPLTLTEANLNEGGVTSTLTSGTLTVMTLVFGDVTGNGDVTAYDASWVLEYVAQDLVGTTIQFPIETAPPSWATVAILPADAFSVADVDANSLVQAMDGSLILQHDVDLISTFAADSAAPSRAVTPSAYRLTASATSERPDARITVSLDASALNDLYAGELGLEFDAEIIRPVTVYLDRSSKRAKPPLLVRADGEGRLGVAFASAKPIPARDATLRIVFEPVGSIDGPIDGAIRSSRLGLNATRVDPAFVYRFHIEPFRFQALANYPNPFNPETWIPFELSADSDVTIHLYGLDGRRVRTLAIGRRGMGVHAGRDAAAYWDGANAFGERVSSGVYVYELIAGSQRAMRRMVVLK